MTTALSALTGNADLALSASQQAPKTSGSGINMPAARKAAQDFESFFASQFLQEEFANVKTDSLFGGGHGEDMFRSLLLDQYAKQMSKSGSLGIGNMVLKSMLQQQEVASQQPEAAS